MDATSFATSKPGVRLAGEFDYPEFAEALALLTSTARIEPSADAPVELIVVAQSRPDTISSSNIASWRRSAPLAGVVGLLGSFCEGETRTGRPWPGVERLYWHEFPAWWQRQLALRRAGFCPDWARVESGHRFSDFRSVMAPANDRSEFHNAPRRGLIVVATPVRTMADVLSETLKASGYATVWLRPGRPSATVRGAAAGIWDGGQLDEGEADELAAFARILIRDHAPVLAMLDFPRFDRRALARKLGATMVIGKPWLTTDLVATIDQLASTGISATDSRAA